MGRGLAAFGANVLGAAHEVKAGYSSVKSGKSTFKDTLIEGVETVRGKSGLVLALLETQIWIIAKIKQ